MHRLIPVLGILMTACTAPPPVVGFRDPSQQMYSSAVLDTARLPGAWAQTADFAEQTGCRAAGVSFLRAGAQMQIAGQLCLAGSRTDISGTLIQIGPGRFAVAGLSDPFWILWADADIRTLVIGTPSGRFGIILNRQTVLPPDRLTAARDVFAWNGYDPDRMKIIP